MHDDERFGAKEKSQKEKVLERIEELSHLDEIEFELAKKDAAKELDVTQAFLTKKVIQARESRAFQKLRELSEKLDAEQAAAAELLPEQWAESAREIIDCEDILGLFEADWQRLIAEERQTGKLLFLAGTSRLLSKPMSIAVKGSSSGGKSEVRKTALRFFPEEDIISFTTLSERALLYEERDFPHMILSMGEAAGAEERSLQDYLLRELLSEGVLRYPTVQKVGDQMVTITITKNGPVSFMVTTTKLKLHPENETRMLSVDVDDSAAQTKAVLFKIAEHETATSAGPGFEPWQNFQRWLASGDRRVTIPYLPCLAAAMPPKSVRLRRDFTQVATAIRAHALLHRRHRPRDEEGVITANIEHDYAVIRELMHDLLREGSEVGVKATTKETADAVETLTKGLAGEEGVTAVTVAKKLKLDKSAARRRLVDAAFAGLVVNLETRKGQAGKYRTTGESVEAEEMMPNPERLAEMFGAANPVPPVPPCHRSVKDASYQAINGGTNGGNSICHPCEPESVASPSATASATAETPAELPKTEGRWHGGNGGNGFGDAEDIEAEREERAAIESEPDPFDSISIPAAFRRSPSLAASST